MKISCGFNPKFFSDLPLPDCCEMIELGWDAYHSIRRGKASSRLEALDRSLHINRSPITLEGWKLDELSRARLRRLGDDPRLISIGLHLTGAPNAGIGRYGYSSHYEPSWLSERRAVDFVHLLQDVTQKPIWLENSNFYSPTPSDIVRSTDSASRICERTGARLIVDLSHLFIDCKNNNADLMLILGRVHWDHVVEVHLSGIKVGSDGTYHDAHSNPVHKGCWTALEALLRVRVVASDIYVNIEHTDAVWASDPSKYLAEFCALEKLLAEDSETIISPAHLKMHEYALRDVERISLGLVRNFAKVCEANGLDPIDVRRRWSIELRRSDPLLTLQSGALEALWGLDNKPLSCAFEEFLQGVVNEARS